MLTRQWRLIAALNTRYTAVCQRAERGATRPAAGGLCAEAAVVAVAVEAPAAPPVAVAAFAVLLCSRGPPSTTSLPGRA